MSSTPLENITIIEIAESVAGPFCGRLLAAFGANVVKVELPLGSDRLSHQPLLSDASSNEANALHQYLNMGKKSVIADWREEEGMEALTSALAGADVIIEDWNCDTRDAHDLDSRIESVNPGIIDLSITPFGSSGPYKRWRSTPLVSLAMGGFLYLSGDEDREPLMMPGYQSEYLAGLHGYAGVMLALGERDLTGAGRRVEVSEIESLAALHQFTTVMHTYGGFVRSRHGARWENKGGYGRYPITVLPCKDGWISFAVSTEGQWEMLFPMAGCSELLSDPRFATFIDRREHADAIDAILIDWMKDKTRGEVFELAAGTWSEPAAPLLELAEVLEDSQLRHRGFFIEMEDADGIEMTVPTVPFHMSATPPAFSRAPRPGEHGQAADWAQTAARVQPPNVTESSSARMDSPAARGLLGDLRILDLTRVWSGPLATRILADFGADVIKISDPRIPLDRSNGTNNKLNRNKPSLALRLDLESGRDAFLKLASTADVIIENFRPRVMRNFRLTYEHIRRVRPDVVMCSMSGFGVTGDYQDYPAFGPSVEAMTGLPSMMGYEGGPPRTSALAFPDPIAGLNALVAVFTALRHRRLTGEGQFIDLALSEGPICQIGEHIVQHSRTGLQPPRSGNSHHEYAPYGVYPTRGDDEWIAICVIEDYDWSVLCRILDMHEYEGERELTTSKGRHERRAELDARVAERTREWDGVELTAALQEEYIPAGRVAKNWQLLEDPHLMERGFFVEIDEPDAGVKRYPGQPIRMAGLDESKWSPSARLGEHSLPILRELLGMSANRVRQLENEQVIGVFREA